MRLRGRATESVNAFLADVVLVVHFAFVLFVTGGLVLIWIGTTIGLTGWAIAGIAIAQHTPGHMNDATNGFVVFMIGVGIALVGQYGASTSTPRRRR